MSDFERCIELLELTCMIGEGDELFKPLGRAIDKRPNEEMD